MISEKGVSTELLFDPLNLKMFKPDDLPVSLIINGNLRFEVEVYEGDMSFEQFLNEIGYLISNDCIKLNIKALKSVYEFSMSANIEIAPKRNFGDNSNEAILTREVLKESPHCSPQEFKSIAFDLCKTLGFSKEALKNACDWYA